jgi:hypothetical protein
MGAMPNKTDRNDARGIARIMRTEWYRAVHVKSPSCRTKWSSLQAWGHAGSEAARHGAALGLRSCAS